MTQDSLRVVILGLSITSSWGNGHATTYRSLVKGLEELPSAKELRAFGERWRPHGIAAAWFLWRAADAAKQSPKTPTP